MDAFTQLIPTATSTFASTTGVSIQQIAAYATSSVIYVFARLPLLFLEENFKKMLSYGLIFLVLLVPLLALRFYRR